MAKFATWQADDVTAFEGQVWGWFVGIGAALTLLGAIASANLALATITAAYVVGAVMFVAGLLQLVHGFGARRWTWATFWTASGLLYLVAAIAVAYNPLFAASFLTLFVAMMLGASGLVRTSIAIRWRGRGRGWMLISGLVSIAAAGLIAIGWPANTAWLLGLVLAVDLMVQGFTLMLIGFTFRFMSRR